jgi:hypothetical protein
MNCGSTASARAMPIRCRCPPENSCGKRRACSGARPTSEQFAHARLALRRRDAVDQKRLGDDVADHHARIERCIGILEDHLDVTSQRPHGAPRQRRHVDAAAGFGRKSNRAFGRRQRAEDTARDSGFAATALADQRKRFAAADRKAHVLDGAHPPGLALQKATLDREFLGQAIHLKHIPAGDHIHSVASACDGNVSPVA